MSDVRLIDANSFKRFLQALCKAGAPYDDVIKLLDKEPTVYNVDKVLIELDEQTNLHNISEASDYWTWITAMEKAIDIVKRGRVE